MNLNKIFDDFADVFDGAPEPEGYVKKHGNNGNTVTAQPQSVEIIEENLLPSVAPSVTESGEAVTDRNETVTKKDEQKQEDINSCYRVTELPPFADIQDGDIEERAAIIQEGAGIPAEWADGYAQMCAMGPPAGFSVFEWREAVDAAGRFLDEWAESAAAFGWSAAEIFGFRPGAPLADHSQRGLIYYLTAGVRIVAITPETAVFEHRRGVRHSRHRERIEPGGVPAWRVKNQQAPEGR